MSVATIDLSALSQNHNQAVNRILERAFDKDNGGGAICDLIHYGSEGSTSFIWYDYSEDKLFIQRTTEDTSPGRLVYIGAIGSAMASGQTIQAMQIRSRATGTGTIAGGTDGVEIKAGLNSNDDTGTLAQARAVIANVDAKKGTITLARMFECTADVGAGGTITTLAGFRVSLNNSGTVTTSYAFILDGTSVWTYGLYLTNSKMTTGIYVGTCTTAVVINSATTGISVTSATTAISIAACTTAALVAACTHSGTTARNFIELTVTDTATCSTTVYSRGLYINWTNTGDRTGSAEINAIGLDFALQGNVAYAYGLSIYGAHSGNPTIGLIEGISQYWEDLGSGAGSFYGMELGTNFSTNATPGAALKYRNHATNALTSVIEVQGLNGSSPATYLLDFVGAVVGPCIADTGAPGASATYKIACRHNGTAFWLAGYASI